MFIALPSEEFNALVENRDDSILSSWKKILPKKVFSIDPTTTFGEGLEEVSFSYSDALIDLGNMRYWRKELKRIVLELLEERWIAA